MTDKKNVIRLVQKSAREDAGRLVPAPTNPMGVARAFVNANYLTEGHLLLRHHGGIFFAYDGQAWPEIGYDSLKSDLYAWLEDASYEKVTKTGPEIVPFDPTKYKVANAIEALQAVTHLSASTTAPTWLNGRGDVHATEMVPMANGLLHLPTRTLEPLSPALFVHHSLGFGYAADAPPPERWLAFLRELWSDDPESIDCLAEIMGYAISADTSQQKAFAIIGPKRSGKGTIARVLTGLLGAHNVAAPTLAGLTTNFGLSPLVAKPAAIISDARLGKRADAMIAVERLLAISGEDSITIDRKYKEPWTGRLPTRFLILTNEIPAFTDASGALASRFVLLTLTTSFYGRENPKLTDELLAEAPGILNWCLAGLDRLHARGYFAQPASAREAIRHLEDMSSPVAAFVRDLCVIGGGYEIAKDHLWAAWREWASEEGRASAGTKAVFIRDLRAAYPAITPRRRGADAGVRRHVLHGITLQQHSSGSLTTRDADPRTAGVSGVSGVQSIVDGELRRRLPGDDGFLEQLYTAFEEGRVTEHEWHQLSAKHQASEAV